MSLLTLVQNTTKRLGIPTPTSVIGNSAENIVQLLALANEEGQELADRYEWSSMVKENQWTMTAAEDQGRLNSAVVSSGDFDYVINNTMWDLTTDIPIYGALSTHTWAARQALASSGPYTEFKIIDRNLKFYPAPSAANTGMFYYKSTFWCETSGGTGQTEWAADTDVGILDERIMELGLRWRWKKTKGLEYSEDFMAYERRVKNAMARDGGKSVLRMNAGVQTRRPGILVPQGSWTP